MNTSILCLCLLEQTAIAYQSNDWETWTPIHIKGESFFSHQNELEQIQIMLNEINQAFNFDDALRDVHVCIIYAQSQAKLAFNTLMLATNQFQNQNFSSYSVERMLQYYDKTNRIVEKPDIQHNLPEWIQKYLLILLDFGNRDRQCNLYSFIDNVISTYKGWELCQCDSKPIIKNIANTVMDFVNNSVGVQLTRDVREFSKIIDDLISHVLFKMHDYNELDIAFWTDAYMYIIMEKTFSQQDLEKDCELDNLMKRIREKNPVLDEAYKRYYRDNLMEVPRSGRLSNYLYDTIIESREWNGFRGNASAVAQDMVDAIINMIDTNLGSVITKDGRQFDNVMDGLVSYVVSQMRKDSPEEVMELSEAYIYEIFTKSFDRREIMNVRRLRDMIRNLERDNPIVAEMHQASIQPSHTHNPQPKPEPETVKVDLPTNNIDKHNYVYWGGYEEVCVNNQGKYFVKEARSNVEFDYELHRTDKIIPELRLSDKDNMVASLVVESKVNDALKKRIEEYLVTVVDEDTEESESSFNIDKDSSFVLNDLQYLTLGTCDHSSLNLFLSDYTNKPISDIEGMTIIYPVVNYLNTTGVDANTIHEALTWEGFFKLPLIDNLPSRSANTLQCYAEELLNICFIECGYDLEINGLFRHSRDVIGWMDSNLDKESRGKFNTTYFHVMHLRPVEVEGIKRDQLAFRENVVSLPFDANRLPWYDGGKDSRAKVILKGSKVYNLLTNLFSVRAEGSDRQQINNIILLFSDGVCMSVYRYPTSGNMYMFVRRK